MVGDGGSEGGSEGRTFSSIQGDGDHFCTKITILYKVYKTHHIDQMLFLYSHVDTHK